MFSHTENHPRHRPGAAQQELQSGSISSTAGRLNGSETKPAAPSGSFHTACTFCFFSLSFCLGTASLPFSCLRSRHSSLLPVPPSLLGAKSLMARCPKLAVGAFLLSGNTGAGRLYWRRRRPAAAVGTLHSVDKCLQNFQHSASKQAKNSFSHEHLALFILYTSLELRDLLPLDVYK